MREPKTPTAGAFCCEVMMNQEQSGGIVGAKDVEGGRSPVALWPSISVVNNSIQFNLGHDLD